ncbi:glycosyltransferase family 2 protein [Maricaulis sp. CAU 1757]
MMMTTDNSVREATNTASTDPTPRLISVLVPFYCDDPEPLLRTLDRLNAGRRDIEIVLHDDGEPDPKLNGRLSRLLGRLDTPVRLLTSLRNRGRSAGRNLLAERARGEWLLYLDADMQPTDETFFERYRDRIENDDFDAAFGGYHTDWPSDPRLWLHAALARTSDQHDAARRTEIGPTAVCSSNLLVRRSVMRVVPFDEGYQGWGFEDVDWAVRAARRFDLVHLDNPARHGGLQDVDTLLAKFRDGAVNYQRLIERNPELARLPLARAARSLAFIPMQARLRGLWAAFARNAALPVRLRTAGLKLWRASWTAEMIR